MQNSKVEDGVWLELTGEVGSDGDYPKCRTMVLDHPDRVDYAAGSEAVFDTDNKEDQDIMSTCYKVRQGSGSLVEHDTSGAGFESSISNNDPDQDHCKNLRVEKGNLPLRQKRHTFVLHLYPYEKISGGALALFPLYCTFEPIASRQKGKRDSAVVQNRVAKNCVKLHTCVDLN